MPSFPDAMPLHGLLGGLMIGTAAAIMLLVAGRIAGVSGMAARALGLSTSRTPRPLALAFLAGLVIGAGAVALLSAPVVSRLSVGWPVLLAAGLIVGFGTRLGSGCTSGHGVCGVSRLSRRSLVATLTFMLAGFVTVAAVNAMGYGP